MFIARQASNRFIGRRAKVQVEQVSDGKFTIAFHLPKPEQATYTTPAAPETSEPIRIAPTPEPPIIVEIPRNIHFGLDDAFINPKNHQVPDQIVAMMHT